MSYLVDNAEHQHYMLMIKFRGLMQKTLLMRLSEAMIENIRLRVSPEEKRALRVAATKRGLTLSEYIRRTATEAARRVAA